MTKKPLRLGERIRESVIAQARPTSAWFSLLPADAQKELEALKRDWRSGDFASPKRTLARSIMQQCADAGLKTCGIQGIESWLSRD